MPEMKLYADSVSLEYYQKSEKKELQGTYASIQSYLRQGFIIDQQKSRNGYWLLFKPVQAWIRVKCGEASYLFDMSWAIKTYYGQARISQGLVNRFINDCLAGQVHVLTDGKTFQIR